MNYKIRHAPDALKDVIRVSSYIANVLKNSKASQDFINKYIRKTESLIIFPYGYRCRNFIYMGYKVRIKPFDSYNIFYTVDRDSEEVIILRVLKNRQDWETLFNND